MTLSARREFRSGTKKTLRAGIDGSITNDAALPKGDEHFLKIAPMVVLIRCVCSRKETGRRKSLIGSGVQASACSGSETITRMCLSHMMEGCVGTADARSAGCVRTCLSLVSRNH